MAELAGVGSTAESSRVVSAEELRPLLDRILASRHFASAGRRKKFLTVVVDFYLAGRADQLNEFCLAAEVFGFDQHYDPAGNASVRVCAHNVRKHLKEYFEQEGAGERLDIQIPPGTYKPRFLERAPPSPPFPQLDRIPSAGRSRRVLPVVIGGALALLGIGAFWSRGPFSGEQSPTGFWRPLLEGQGPVLVVMSNPPLFQF
jgi:hypothetical protein